MNYDGINTIQSLQNFDNIADVNQAIPRPTTEQNIAGDSLSDLISGLEQPPVFSVGMSQETKSTSNTLGDAILRRLDRLGSSFRQKVDQVSELLETPAGDFSLQKMLKLQMQVSMVSIEIEIVGKGVQKAVQHADQLTKLQ